MLPFNWEKCRNWEFTECHEFLNIEFSFRSSLGLSLKECYFTFHSELKIIAVLGCRMEVLETVNSGRKKKIIIAFQMRN